MTDIIDDFIQRLKAAAPDVPPQVHHQLEGELRKQWGGTEPYVGKRMNRVTRTSLLAAGLRQKRPLSEVFASAGVGKRTGYRILGEKK